MKQIMARMNALAASAAAALAAASLFAASGLRAASGFRATALLTAALTTEPLAAEGNAQQHRSIDNLGSH
jgi:hypothetical protein